MGDEAINLFLALVHEYIMMKGSGAKLQAADAAGKAYAAFGRTAFLSLDRPEDATVTPDLLLRLEEVMEKSNDSFLRKLLADACVRFNNAAVCEAPPFLLYTTFAWDKLYEGNNAYDYGALRRYVHAQAAHFRSLSFAACRWTTFTHLKFQTRWVENMILPVNSGGVHWAAGVLNQSSLTALYYDPLKRSGEQLEPLHQLRLVTAFPSPLFRA